MPVPANRLQRAIDAADTPRMDPWQALGSVVAAEAARLHDRLTRTP